MKHYLYLIRNDNPGEEAWEERKLVLRAEKLKSLPKRGEWTLTVGRAQLNLTLLRAGRTYGLETETSPGDSRFEYLHVDTFDVPGYDERNKTHTLVLTGRAL